MLEDNQFFLIIHTAHVSVFNILRPTAPCCTISEDQNRWKIKLKAGNDDSCVLFTSGLYSGMRSSPIDWRSVQLHEI